MDVVVTMERFEDFKPNENNDVLSETLIKR